MMPLLQSASITIISTKIVTQMNFLYKKSPLKQIFSIANLLSKR